MHLQPRLFPQSQFPPPTPLGAGHYVPVLKTLPGEMRALETLGTASRDRMTPLIEVSARTGETDEAAHRSQLPNLPARLATIIGERPFFLDFPWLSSGKRLTVRQGKSRRDVPAVECVIEECERLALSYVPVISPSTDERRSRLIREVAAEGRGVCVRLAASRSLAETGIDDEIDRLLEQVQVTPAETDIVVDLEYIDPEPGYDVSDLQPSGPASSGAVAKPGHRWDGCARHAISL